METKIRGTVVTLVTSREGVFGSTLGGIEVVIICSSVGVWGSTSTSRAIVDSSGKGVVLRGIGTLFGVI